MAHYRVVLHITLQIERSGRRRGLRREVMKLKIERSLETTALRKSKTPIF
jgi:hypothetical protein